MSLFVPLCRQYFSDVIATAMKEMQDFGSFKSLLEALGRERDNRMNFHEAITRSGWWWMCLSFSLDVLSPCYLGKCLDPRSSSCLKVAGTTDLCQISWSTLQYLLSHMHVYVVCMCVYACLLVWGRMYICWVHICVCVGLRLTLEYFLSVSHLIVWGRISQQNPELTYTASLATQLAPGISCLCIWRAELPYSGLQLDAPAPGFVWVLGLQTQDHTS